MTHINTLSNAIPTNVEVEVIDRSSMFSPETGTAVLVPKEDNHLPRRSRLAVSPGTAESNFSSTGSGYSNVNNYHDPKSHPTAKPESSRSSSARRQSSSSALWL